MAPAPDMLLRVVVVLSALIAAARAAFVPADNLFVACGTAAIVTVGSQSFVGDATLPASVLSAPQSAAANASAGSSPANASSDEQALYQSARVFPAPSTYTFGIKRPGRHFVRLHFFPFRYQSGDLAADARFRVSVQGVEVTDGPYTPANGTATVREFSVSVAGGTLAVSFTPTGKGVAFVNAIEVVSHPDDLFAGSAQTVSTMGTYAGLSTQALETIHRINMGTPKITPNNDTLWRTWLPDETFLVDRNVTEHKVAQAKSLQRMNGLATAEAAPDMVYATATELNKTLMDGVTISAQFNMTWSFQATPGRAYLLRLHFCDFISTAALELVFNVYIGGWSVLPNYEITKDTFGQLAVPLYKDFVLSATDVTTGNITVSVGPSTLGTVDPDGLLNGLEIMRLVGTTGGGGDPSSGRHSKKMIAGIAAGSAVAATTVVTALAFIVLRLRRRRKKPEKKPSSTWAAFSASALGGTRSFGKSNSGSGGTRNNNNNTVTVGAGFRFPLAAVQEATGGFDEGMVIGVGGFGKVYKGTLRDETRVAVKRGNRRSQQGLNEFRTEIEMLSRLRHRHLVSLIGYCDERGEMILVYEYMAKGTLRSHLYDSELPPLTWKQRLEVSIGAARGLHYLHTGSTKAIIHRDVKSANILLDDGFMAKVADFGLSKTGPELDKTHVSTAVKGSFGYLDPEYFRRQMLTEKSDVYSFGVVLLEVLCARPVIDPTLPPEMVNLAEWATKRLKNGELDSIVDQRIAETIRPESLKKFADTAEKCLAEYGVERPAMGDVLWCLEYALQLQEGSPSPDSSGTDDAQPVLRVASKYQRNQSNASDGTAANMSANLGDLDGMSMRRVFSKMMKSEEGR